MIQAQLTLFLIQSGNLNKPPKVVDMRAGGTRLMNCDHFEGCGYPWASSLSVTVVAVAGS